MRELPDGVQVGEHLVERDRHEMQTRIGRDLRDVRQWLLRHTHRGVGFTFGDPLVGCRGERVGQLDLLDVDAETLEDDRRRQGC